MIKKITFSVVISAAIIAGVFWYFYTGKVTADINNPINLIPEDASVIFESKSIEKLWDKISQTNIIWEEFLAIENVNKINLELRHIDSLIKSNNDISALLNNAPTVLAFIKTDKSNFDILFAHSLPDLTYQNITNDFLKTINSGNEIIYENYKSEKIGFIKNEKIYYSDISGTIVISPNKALIIRAIEQFISGKTLLNETKHKRVFESAGKKSDASIFINYKNIPALLPDFLNKQSLNKATTISNFAEFSGWDILIKPNAISLSGFSYSNDTTTAFLSAFQKQTPQKIEVIKILPSSTSYFVNYGIDNFDDFRERYTRSLKQEQQQYYNEIIDHINSENNINLLKELRDCTGNELCYSYIGNTTDSIDYYYCIIQSPDLKKAKSQLKSLENIFSSVSKSKTDTLFYKGYTIHNLGLKNICAPVYGNIFENIRASYYTFVYNYIVFSNSTTELKYFIDEFENNKTLANDKNYKLFSENAASESNVYFYSSIPKSITTYKNLLTGEYAHDLLKHEEKFKTMEAFSMQFSNTGNNLYYSNIFLRHNPETKKQKETLWELPIDTTISSKPYIVINHNTKAKEIVIQDDANKLYLISNTGKILWTKQLDEKIMGDVMQVDAYKNDKLQILFNTRSYIYLIDRNGNHVNGFPIKLKSQATNAVSVIDYENNKDYRLFIATENKRVLCYKANGEQVTGFGFDKTENQVITPVIFFNTNAKDHICFVDVKGKIYIVNRQGETRIKIKENLPPGIRNYFIDIGKDYSKSSIIASDTLGNIFNISLTGNKETTTFQTFESSPYFEFRDIDNDKIKEYILLTRNELKVFSATKQLLFKYDFKNKISGYPLVFKFKDGNCKIGVVSNVSNEIFLFHENGSLYDKFPLTGNTPFSISDLNNQGIYNLITGTSEKSIFVYQLE